MKSSLVARFLPAAAASAILALVAATRPLPALARAVAVACVVASWAAAAILRQDQIRAHATAVLALAAAIAAGQVAAGPAYGVAAAMLLLACLVSMRAARAGDVRRGEAYRAELRPALVLLATAAIVGGGLVVGLPRAAERIERHIDAMFGVDGVEATAFSTTMVLGSTRGMLQSDAIVMRIEGERPEYLRGAVYDRYEPPFWVASRTGRERREIPAPATSPGATRITLVRGAPNGDDMRWFLPGAACDLGVPSGTIEVDGFGVARRARGEDPPTVTYRTEGCSTPPAPVAPPGPADLDVPPRVKQALAPIAGGWTAGATTDREKLRAIEHELSRFEYSLAVARDSGLDPVVDFVSVHRAGHCEMFASAMVLMARTQGIPARVVGGYHVTDVNPLTGRAVVRDRNAHAWVEAWVDGAWRGWDPTPTSESFRSRSGPLEHLGDLIALGADSIVSALARLGLLGVAAVLAGVVVVLFTLRWLGAHLRARRRERRGAGERSRPLPCFEELTAALARAGHSRDESEPIEAFARRLARAPATWAHETSQALLAYASLRYGGLGDEVAVTRAIDRATRSVRSAERT